MAQKFAVTTPLRITDTTFRDGHQSLAATRMRTREMAPIAPEMDKVGFASVEVWGGATFDVAIRTLFEDPWERIRTLKRLMPRTPLQMLLRGQNLVGYRIYPDDVVEAFVKHAARCGIDVFRIFDALNDERNLVTALRAVKEAGKHAQLAVCYSVTEEGRLGGPVYTLDYFLDKAKILQEMGADSLCIKDMAGLLAPYDAFLLVQALRERVRIPVQLHTHYTSGMASMTVLKAAEAGVDLVDACLSPLALRTSQPAVEPLVMALRGTPRETGLDLERLIKLSDDLEELAPSLRPHMADGRLSVVDPRAVRHQVPGGMASNLVAQLQEAGALDRLPQVLQELPRTRRELGYPPLVTPISQIIGVQAVNNVLFGRWKVIPSQVKDYVYGSYGRPPAPLDPKVAELVLKQDARGREPFRGRPADAVEPEMEKAREATKGLAKDTGDVLTYALYPVTGRRLLRVKYGKEAPPEEPGPQPPGPWPGATAAASPLPARARAFNVSVAGRAFQVTVDPVGAVVPAAPVRSPATMAPQVRPPAPSPAPASPRVASTPAPAKSAPTLPGEKAVTAPMPGVVVRYTVEVGQRVQQGQTTVVLEAMKMENTLPAPAQGVVKRLGAAPGAKVAKGEQLVIIAPEG